MTYWSMTEDTFYCFPSYGLLMKRMCAGEVRWTRDDVARECGWDVVERIEAHVKRNKYIGCIDRRSYRHYGVRYYR